MNYFIITGGSKGLGHALAVELLKVPENFVITISRTAPVFASKNASFFQYDLSQVGGIAALMNKVFDSIPEDIRAIYLINNAGRVSPIGPLDACPEEQIIEHFNLNSVAPAILSASLIKRYKSNAFKRGILNISTGAARKPYEGWSCYCSSKASLAMLTECAALENPEFEISMVDPGVVDTAMQAEIRSVPRERFQSVEKFKAFKEEHKLLEPAEAARKIISQYFATLTPTS